MKNLAIVFLTILTMFSCSDRKENTPMTSKKAKFKIEFTQSGDLDHGVIQFILLSDAKMSNILHGEILQNDFFNEAKTYTFETLGKADNFKFLYSHGITALPGINEDSKINTTIKVYKDDILIIDKDYELTKDNPDITDNSDELNY